MVDPNAGGMDPYAYVGDSPEGRTDPTGHCWPWCTALIGAVVGAAVSVAVTAVTDAAQGKTPSAGELLQAAVVGGVSGAIVGVVGPEAGPLARVAVGALASGVGQMAGNAIAGKSVMDGVGQAVIAGAITGGLVEGAGALLKGAGSAVVEESNGIPKFLFRGTSEGYPGNPGLQTLGITPASTDPAVATAFAANSARFGRGIVQIATSDDLAGVTIGPGDYLSEMEKSVTAEISPSEFSGRASISISVSSARGILSDMGVYIPSVLTNDQMSPLLTSMSPLTEEQILRFASLAAHMGYDG